MNNIAYVDRLARFLTSLSSRISNLPLNSFKNGKTKLVQNINTLSYLIMTEMKPFFLLWIFAHVDIKGNVQAGSQAKQERWIKLAPSFNYTPLFKLCCKIKDSLHRLNIYTDCSLSNFPVAPLFSTGKSRNYTADFWRTFMVW